MMKKIDTEAQMTTFFPQIITMTIEEDEPTDKVILLAITWIIPCKNDEENKK